MRYMLMIKASEDTEAGVPPTPEQLQAMGALMEDMAKAGVLLGGDGLQPSSKGKRMKISGGKVVSVTDGPFAETKELVAGYAVLQVASYEELMEWNERFAAIQGEGECEIRPLYESSDFITEGFTAEDAAREEALRRQLAGQQ
jgi:hypothetical protein